MSHRAIFCEWMIDLMKALSLSHNAEVFYPECIAIRKHSEVFRYSKTQVGANKNPFKQPLTQLCTNILKIWLVNSLKIVEANPFFQY